MCDVTTPQWSLNGIPFCGSINCPPSQFVAKMIEGVFNQSGSNTVGVDVASFDSEGRPDGWNCVVRTSGLNCTFLGEIVWRVIQETLHYSTDPVFLQISKLSLDAMSKISSGVRSTTSNWWLSNSVVVASIVEQ